MEQLAKNQRHTAEITGYAADGSGVCRVGGRAVFVKNTVVGETWEIRILKVTAAAVYGKAERCVTPSPNRREPPCPVYPKCGGCSLLHMTYDEELRMKRTRLNDALRRIGGLDFQITEILGMDRPEHYRNKAIYAAGMSDGVPVKGFYRALSHDVIPVASCLLQQPLADRAAETVCRWMASHNVAPYDEATGKGTVRHIVIRCAAQTPEAVLCIVSARGFGARTEQLVETLRARCPELTGIVLNVNKQKGNVVLAGDFYTLWGKAELEDVLCGLRFTLSPQAFYQVNPVQAERLYARAVSYAVASPADTVLDLYCGAGTISLCLAQRAARVIGAEIVPEAVRNAAENARANAVENAEFLCADAGEAAALLAERGMRPNCVVVDPPRKGMAEAATRAVASMRPERIVYVSCDPGTLARDLKRLHELAYSPAAGTAVDMFPHTASVETVCLLTREKSVKSYAYVDITPSELGMGGKVKKPTYKQIQAYVLETHGLKVSPLYIANVKDEFGLEKQFSYEEAGMSAKKRPNCPPEKRAAIIDALIHFGMLDEDARETE